MNLFTQVELLSDTSSEDPPEHESIRALAEECSQLFAAVIERSHHSMSEIESQYGSRPLDPEVRHLTEALTAWLSDASLPTNRIVFDKFQSWLDFCSKM